MKISYLSIIGKVFLRVILFFLILEGLLRLGGAIFLWVQDYQNKINLGKENEYRIMCVGASMTALGGEDSYPKQLEKILNSQQNDSKFSVINKGIPSFTTGQIASRLENFLDEYKPHIVVSMVGINDDPNAFVEKDKNLSFLDRFRSYELAKRIWSKITHRDKKEEQAGPLDQIIKKFEEQANHKPKSTNFAQLAGLYRATSQWEKEREALLKAVELNPNNYEAFGYLGWNYKRFGQYKEAVTAFEKWVELSPPTSESRMLAYANLAECYKLWGNYKESERVYLESIDHFPNHPGAFGCLGDLYLEQERYDDAEKFYHKQLEVNPKASLWYGKLAHCYRRNGRLELAERLLLQVIKLNPKEMDLYRKLGSCLIEDKKYEVAEGVLKKALELSSQDQQEEVKIYSLLSESYEAQGKLPEAEKFKKLVKMSQENFNTQTKDDYQRIRETLTKRGISLVAVQYPMRDVNLLKQILPPSRNTRFVDNKESFEEAVASEGYYTYFVDRFGGEFGHCTPKGNNLIASNIANVILAEIKK